VGGRSAPRLAGFVSHRRDMLTPADRSRIGVIVLPLPRGGTARFDAAYPELLLGFEADGDAFHKGLLDRMRDEARDGQCGQIGWTVRRYSSDDIRLRPAGVAEEVDRLRRGTEAA
jgi:hypothetical protein